MWCDGIEHLHQSMQHKIMPVKFFPKYVRNILRLCIAVAISFVSFVYSYDEIDDKYIKLRDDNITVICGLHNTKVTYMFTTKFFCDVFCIYL